METLNVGLVGYGFAGKTFHAPVIAGVPGLQLVAVASSDAARVQADWPGMAVEPQVAGLLARGDIDLVVVATPNASHHLIARAALQADCHVVVDKPFTVTLAEARDLEAVARDRGRQLAVFHNRRWDADFLTVRALIESGVLGRIVHFESHFDRFRPTVRPRWRERPDGGGGLWFDLGPHLLDQVLCLFGWPQSIYLDRALARDAAQADDWFHAVLRFPEPDGRLRVVLHGSALVGDMGPRFQIHGTHGSFVKFGLDPQEGQLRSGYRPRHAAAGESVAPLTARPIWGKDDHDGTLTLYAAEDLPPVQRKVPTALGDYLSFWVALRAAIVGNADNPVPAADGIRVMTLIEAGVRSDRERREIECVLTD
jgi:predicted dehydrogenase